MRNNLGEFLDLRRGKDHFIALRIFAQAVLRQVSTADHNSKCYCKLVFLYLLIRVYVFYVLKGYKHSLF
jgi:hypothetical protein